MKELLQIKKIIALLLTIVFCYLSAIKYVSTTEFLSVFTMVIGFYFGQSSIRQTLKEQSNVQEK